MAIAFDGSSASLVIVATERCCWMGKKKKCASVGLRKEE
jgi:hypothetical protein